MMLPDSPERDTAGFILAAVLALFFLSLLTACSTTRTLVRDGAVHTEYIDRLHESRDSIYLHDSVYIYASGDTIYRDRWRYRYRDRLLRDTVYLHKVDSVYVETQVRKASAIDSAATILRLIGGSLILGALLALLTRASRLWK